MGTSKFQVNPKAFTILNQIPQKLCWILQQQTQPPWHEQQKKKGTRAKMLLEIIKQIYRALNLISIVGNLVLDVFYQPTNDWRLKFCLRRIAESNNSTIQYHDYEIIFFFFFGVKELQEQLFIKKLNKLTKNKRSTQDPTRKLLTKQTKENNSTINT